MLQPPEPMRRQTSSTCAWSSPLCLRGSPFTIDRDERKDLSKRLLRRKRKPPHAPFGECKRDADAFDSRRRSTLQRLRPHGRLGSHSRLLELSFQTWIGSSQSSHYVPCPS